MSEFEHFILVLNLIWTGMTFIGVMVLIGKGS